MGIRIIGSDKIKDKLNKQLNIHNLDTISENKIILVELGYDIPKDCIAIVFDPIDYMEVLDLIKKYLKDSVVEENDMLLGYFEDRYKVIKPSEIQYIEARATEVTCITKDKKYYLKKPLYYYESILQDKSFVRINKSQLVNLMNVNEVIPWFNSRLVLSLDKGIQVEVSKKYSKELRKIIDL